MGEGLASIRRALDLVDDTTPRIERALIETLRVRYDAATYRSREARDRAYYERARALVEEASARPDRALGVADRLESLMPNAGHIVHMPSHIYLRVGRYADAVAQNRRSIEADERFRAAWADLALPFVTSLPMSHT